MSKRKEVKEIWPELDWIQDADLPEKTVITGVRAFERSPFKPQDLRDISRAFSLEDCKASFREQKRLVVQPAYESGLKLEEFLGDDRPVDQDPLIAEAILADHGKLLEYEKFDGACVQSASAACPIVATDAGEGNLVKLTAEAGIVPHAAFLNYEPFVKGLIF
ncbi:MAG: phosphohydrolase [Planctomycetota bacterium]|nr:phosphohydrolase [Planctomycetota bacterium]MDA1114540.1 phosphohydrolase [Planctomycetota bacterium]